MGVIVNLDSKNNQKWVEWCKGEIKNVSDTDVKTFAKYDANVRLKMPYEDILPYLYGKRTLTDKMFKRPFKIRDAEYFKKHLKLVKKFASDFDCSLNDAYFRLCIYHGIEDRNLPRFEEISDLADEYVVHKKFSPLSQR